MRAYLVPEVQTFGAEWRHIHLLGAEALEAWTGLTKIGKYHGSHFTRAEVEALRAVDYNEPIIVESETPTSDEVEEDDEDDSD